MIWTALSVNADSGAYIKFLSVSAWFTQCFQELLLWISEAAATATGMFDGMQYIGGAFVGVGAGCLTISDGEP
ncbi:MAG: hypothetical protein R3A12_02955 [Ignavibacteria bacterium]